MMGQVVTMARALGLVLAAHMLTATTAQSQSATGPLPGRPVDLVPLVELYTSQGCSSCPPADRLMESYAKRRDIAAISLSVDYWDYMGWKDTNAKAAFSARQREYARARGDGQVYTPQMVVNGRDHAVGSDRAAIDAALGRAAAYGKISRVALSMTADGSALHVAIAEGTAMAQPCIVWLAAVKPAVTVAIERGENRGREVTYHNVVQDMVRLGQLSSVGSAALPLGSIRKSAAVRHLAIVQDGKGGQTLAAAWID